MSARKYELITPERALELLDNNTGNRRVSKDTVAQYARAMLAGEWFESEDIQDCPLYVAKSGRLLNGQHRLFAIVSSGCSIHMWVVYGVDENIMPYIDNNKARGINDTLQAYDKSGKIGGPAKFLLAFLKGSPVGASFAGRINNDVLGNMKIAVSSNTAKRANAYVAMTRAEITNFAIANIDFFTRVVSYSARMQKATGGNSGVRIFYSFIGIVMAAGLEDDLRHFIDEYVEIAPSFWPAWAKDFIRTSFLNKRTDYQRFLSVLCQAFDGYKNCIVKVSPKVSYDAPMNKIFELARSNGANVLVDV